MEMESVQDTLNPADRQDDFTEWMRSECGFIAAKRLDDGSYAGIRPLIYTHAICLGVTEVTAHMKRFCFDDAPACLHEWSKLTRATDEPQGWIARRPERP